MSSTTTTGVSVANGVIGALIVFVIVFVVLLLLLAIAYQSGKTSIEADCVHVGGFHNGRSVYECHALADKDKP